MCASRPLLDNSRVLIAIPCYNEEGALASVVEQVLGIADSLSSDVVVAVFDDASEDRSLESLDRFAEIVILHSQDRLGYANNISRILDYALVNRYGALFVIDGDGQHAPENLLPLAKALLDGFDCSISDGYGSNISYRQRFLRRIGVRVYRVILWATGCGWISDPTSGNFALSARAVEYVAPLCREMYILDAAMVLAMSYAGRGPATPPGVFYQNSEASMHDDLIWSIGSFSKVVGVTIRLWLHRRPGSRQST